MAPLSTSSYELRINNLTSAPLSLHLPSFTAPLEVHDSTTVTYLPPNRPYILHLSPAMGQAESDERMTAVEGCTVEPTKVKLKLGRFQKRTRMLQTGEGSLWTVWQQRSSKRKYTLTVLPRVHLSRWMSRLPDSASLASLYIPGTHESLAFYGGPISTCQTTRIPSALRGGIRFLDYRFALKQGKLLAYHGIQNEYCTAEEAFQWVYDFLDGPGKGETVIVSVKQENSSPDFEATMWKLLDRRAEMWYRENRWPTLGEVRGKAVMFCRFGFDSQQGLHPPTWTNNSPTAFELDIGGQPSIIQDWYSIGSFIRIPEKAALVLSLFRPPPSSQSSASPSRSSSSDTLIPSILQKRPLRISFLSGATLITAFPYLVAKGFGYSGVSSLLGFPGVNERVLNGLLDRGGVGEQSGWVGSSVSEEGKGGGVEGGMILLGDFLEYPGGLVELFIVWNTIK